MVLPLAFFENIGMTELLVILFIALILFGGRLPEVARNLGRGISQFKRGLEEAKSEVAKEMQIEEERPSAPKTTETAAPPKPAPGEPASPSCASQAEDASRN